MQMGQSVVCVYLSVLVLLYQHVLELLFPEESTCSICLHSAFLCCGWFRLGSVSNSVVIVFVIQETISIQEAVFAKHAWL
ncbi:hypothetical protein QVD17_02598 [Tagetes erecta]|uniref:Secreted protein n=1 Tax=Tagetes erecta TaxID=13708 RepID=A0AAD8L6W8_TARER|nr:hypothetical protein QVD17_02598 [Tagetes erecta]